MNESALRVILELGPKYGVDLWRHVQYRSHEDAAWRDCTSLEMFDIYDDDYYRVKPLTHVVNGIECPAPIADKPHIRDFYYFYSATHHQYLQDSVWDDDRIDEFRFKIGNCFHTKEDAIANFYAHYPHMRPEAE